MNKLQNTTDVQAPITAPLSERLKNILKSQEEVLEIQANTRNNIDGFICAFPIEDVDSYCLLVSIESIEARMSKILEAAIKIKGLTE